MPRDKYIRVTKGRFAGELLTYSHHGLFGAYTLYNIAHHPLDICNVKAFKVKASYPFYCGWLAANLYCVVWRDDTESYFSASPDVGKKIIRSIRLDYLRRKYNI